MKQSLECVSKATLNTNQSVFEITGHRCQVENAIPPFLFARSLLSPPNPLENCSDP